MADKKISELNSAAAVYDADDFALVQDGDTKQVNASAVKAYVKDGLSKSDVGLGNVDNTSDASKNSATATLTNKTISGSSNTLSNIGNSSLTNSSITLGSTSISLGGTASSITGLALTGGTVNNTAIGGTTPAAGAFTTLSSTGNTTLGDASGDTLTINAGTTTFAQGTANGVLYLNGSKVATSGSALTFDGTNLTVSGSAYITGGVSGQGCYLLRNGADGGGVYSSQMGSVQLSAPSTNPITFVTNSLERARITSKGLLVDYTSDSGLSGTGNAIFSGSVGIGTSSPGTKIDVNGAATTNNTSRYLARLGDTSSVSAGNGGGIMFQGVYTGTTLVDGCGIQAYKDNATSGDYAYSMTFATRANGGNLTERMRINSSGNLGLGVTPSAWGAAFKALDIGSNACVSGTTSTQIFNNAYDSGAGFVYKSSSFAQRYQQNNLGQHIWYISGTSPGTAEATVPFTQAMTLDASGNLLVGGTATDPVGTNVAGMAFSASGTGSFSRASGVPVYVNRKTNDGTLVAFYQDGTEKGAISVSGTTVTYNGGHLGRWSQTTDKSIPAWQKGTVLSNLDQMAFWEGEGNEQLNCVKESDIEGDKNVAGVFVSWDEDADMLLAMTGDMVIRIAKGTSVQRGDLLISAGDGTAKPQADDVIRSNTIAKVTSTHVTCVYDDESYCVPCVLMAC